MEQFLNYGDQRNEGWCIHCGGVDETRDHVPSRIFLDEPYPTNLPVVAACQRCNLGFSLDEEYVACLVESVLTGGTEPERISRPKIARLLRGKPGLAARLEKAKQERDGRVVFDVEPVRVRHVLVKLARGRAAFELNGPQLDEPASVLFGPLENMSLEELDDFERAPETHLWPEVGSRALQRLLGMARAAYNDWIEVQPGSTPVIENSEPNFEPRLARLKSFVRGRSGRI
jgi:hypothetical protein